VIAYVLLTALGLAIGITAVGDPRAATHNTVTGLGIGAGIWAALTLLIAYGRFTRRAADDIRTGHQPQDRKATGPDDSSDAPLPGE
jgi:hypothetical protein